MLQSDESESFLALLKPIQKAVAELDLSEPDKAKAELCARFPLASLSPIREMLKRGVESGWLAERENGGIRYGRVYKVASDHEVGIEAVRMKSAGPGHEHPKGEVDLCFAVSGTPTFDGNKEGWTVYGPKSWHVPTVVGGEMDILYFLPGGEIRFGPKAG